MSMPCNFDHNGECLVCDCWPSDCAYVRFVNQDYSFETMERLEQTFGTWQDMRTTLPNPDELVFWYDAMFDSIMYFSLGNPALHDGDFTHFSRKMPYDRPSDHQGIYKNNDIGFYVNKTITIMIPIDKLHITLTEMAAKGALILATQQPVSCEKAKEQVERLRSNSQVKDRKNN